MNGDEGDWDTIAKLPDVTIRNSQDAIMQLGKVGIYSLKRASFK